MNNQDQMNSMEENIVNRINFLKDEIINFKEIVIRNLQDENENLRRWCERLEEWCSKYESDHNALTQYGRRNNGTLSCQNLFLKTPLKNQWYQFWLTVNIYRVVIGLANLIEISPRKLLCVFVNRKNCKKVLFNKKKLSSIDNSKHNAKSKKILQMSIWHPSMSQLPTTAENLSTVVSFLVASREMALSESSVGKKIDLWRFSIWIRFMGFFLTFLLVMHMTRMKYLLIPHK